jgi:Tol biopolymer transport system component
VKAVKPDGHFKPWRARLSADGSRVAFLNMPPVETPKVKWWTLQTVGWLDLDAKEGKPHTIVEVAYHPSVVMSADGKSVYYSHVDMAKVGNEPRKGENLPFESWAFDTATEKKTRLELPADHLIRDVSADGRMLLTTTTEFGSSRQEAYVVPVATMKPERLTETTLLVIHSPRFSPDGSRVLWGKMPDGPFDEKTTGVFVTDVVTKKDTRVNLPKGVGGEFLCWSPDGKRIATSGTRPVSDLKGADTVCEVAVCDADGSNAKVITKREPNRAIMSVDWR